MANVVQSSQPLPGIRKMGSVALPAKQPGGEYDMYCCAYSSSYRLGAPEGKGMMVVLAMDR